MTAFAQIEDSIQGQVLQVRLKSVNHRNLKLHVFCGTNSDLETWITKLLQTHLQRGYVECHVELQKQHHDEKELSQWMERCKAQGLPKPTWSDLYAKRLSTGANTLNIDTPENLHTTIQSCFNLFVERRLEEGKAMTDCMLRDIQTLKSLLQQIHQELPAHHQHRVDRFKNKLQQLLSSLEGETKDNLTRECAQLLERIDVQEECDRLDTHLDRFHQAITIEHRGGKYCDFLCQEIHREITTLGNKSQSALISEWVVSFKTHLEKLREQCQNLE